MSTRCSVVKRVERLLSVVYLSGAPDREAKPFVQSNACNPFGNDPTKAAIENRDAALSDSSGPVSLSAQVVRYDNARQRCVVSCLSRFGFCFKDDGSDHFVAVIDDRENGCTGFRQLVVANKFGELRFHEAQNRWPRFDGHRPQRNRRKTRRDVEVTRVENHVGYFDHRH